MYYEESNNKSVLVENQFLLDTINNWVAEGYIEETEEKPLYTNPLTVVCQNRVIRNYLG